MRGNRGLSAALTGITATVVGVIANLGVYFAVHTLFVESARVSWVSLGLKLPDITTLRPVAVVLTLVATMPLFTIKIQC